MPMRRPAAAIEPVSPIACNSAALPGPIAIDDPSRMRMRGSNRSIIGGKFFADPWRRGSHKTRAGARLGAPPHERMQMSPAAMAGLIAEEELLVRYCMCRASPGGIDPPCQPVLLPWLQPGGVLAPANPDLRPELLNPRGVPMVRALPPPEPRDIVMPPPIPPPPIPPPPRAKAGAVTATAAATATMSVRALNRLFISAPFLLLLFRNEARGTFVPLGGAATLIAPRLDV